MHLEVKSYPTKIPVLDNDGYAVCPNHETQVHCGIVSLVESDEEDRGLEEGSIQNSEGLPISEPSTLTDSMRSIIDAVQNVHEGLLKLYGRAIKRQELTSSSLVSKTALLKNSYLTWKGWRKTLRLMSQ